MAKKTLMSREEFKQNLTDIIPTNLVGCEVSEMTVDKLYRPYTQGANPEVIAEAYAQGVVDRQLALMAR